MAQKGKVKLPKGDAGKAIKRILENRFSECDESTKSELVAELSGITQEYFENYNSEENASLRDFYTLPAMNSPEIMDFLGELDFTIRDFIDQNFYEVLHMFYVKGKELSSELASLNSELEVMKKKRIQSSTSKEKLEAKAKELQNKINKIKEIQQKISNKVDESVIESKTYMASETYRTKCETEGKKEGSFLEIEDFKRSETLEDFLCYAKRTTYSNKLAAMRIKNGVDLVKDNPLIGLMETYSLTEKMQEQIKSNPKSALIMNRFLASVSEYRYEKAYIDAEIEALRKKFPELDNPNSDKKIIVYRSGVIDENVGYAVAKNRYQAYTEEEHIGLGGNGTNSGIFTEYISITESPIVLPVYNLSKRDKQKNINDPLIIDIRKVYELLLARQSKLSKGMCFEGESEFLNCLAEMDFGEESELRLEKLIARLEELDVLPQYERDKSLPEGFFDRERLTVPKVAGKDPHTYAYASAELLFKAAIPNEAITKINPLVMDMMVSTVGTTVFDNFLEKIISNKDFSESVMELINNNTYGLNEVELDFLQRFYVNYDAIDDFILIPELTEKDEKNAYRYFELEKRKHRTKSEEEELDEIKKQFAESGITEEEINALVEEAGIKKLNELRKEQIELGLRTSIVKKLLGNEQFLGEIGINLTELGITLDDFKESLGSLVQATTSGPDNKHRRYRVPGVESVTESGKKYISTYGTKPKVEGITAADELVSITGKEYTLKKPNNTKVRYVKPTPKALEIDGDKGEIQYDMFPVVQDEAYDGYGWVRYSFVSGRPLLKTIPFQIKHCAKSAAKGLEKIVTYYLEDRNNGENTQNNTQEER